MLLPITYCGECPAFPCWNPSHVEWWIDQQLPGAGQCASLSFQSISDQVNSVLLSAEKDLKHKKTRSHYYICQAANSFFS